jgi:flagellar motor switch protein FliN/FliY
MNSPSPTLKNEAVLGPQNDTPSAQVVTLREPAAGEATGPRLLDGNLGLISGVKVRVEVVVGGAELTVADLFALQKGSVVALEQLHHAPLTVRLDGKTIAHGTLVVVGDNFGVRISDIAAATPIAAS